MTSRRLKQGLVIGLVLLSSIWTLLRLNSLDVLTRNLKVHLIVIGVAAGFCEALFVVGALMLLHGTGKHIVREVGFRPSNWVGLCRDLRRGVRTVTVVRGDREAMIGLWINWAGALGTTGVIPIVVIALALPLGAWGLMAPFVVDVAATCALRRTIHLRLRGTAA